MRSDDRRPSRRLPFAALLALTMGVGPYVLYVLSALAPLITVDLGLSRTQLGSLVTVSFGVATASALLAGHLSDRLGSRRAMFLLYVLTGVALMGIAGGPTFGWLIAATALAGFSQSTSNPVTNRLVSARVPAGQRGLLLGVKQSGVQMSQFFAGAVLPSAAIIVGWRGVAAGSIAFVLLGLAATWLLVPDDAQPAPLRSHPLDGPPAVDPMIPWLATYGFLLGVMLQGTNVYLPLYSFEALDFSPQAAGATAGVVGAVGMVSRILWGRGAERLRTAAIPMLLIAVISMGAMTALLAAPWLGPWALWLGVVLFATSPLASTVVLMLAVVRDVPSTQTGRASGQVMLGLYGGFTVGPVTFGLIVDRTGGYTASWLLLLACAFGAVLLCTAWRWRLRR